MKKPAFLSILWVIAATGTLWAAMPRADAHCQIPCGIYDDPVRFTQLEEHIATIEKSMKQIIDLADEAEHANQLVRWVMNKEDHAGQFADIVTAYFLQQRIKPAAKDDDMYNDYIEHVTLCHKMLVTVMKAKQTTDLAHCETLRALVAEFRETYFHEH
ncbi:MAG TPA: superoxide dismutase [Candidatus Hydrogenedentes bacterium]|nr:superoxide dismutase [Candidatus Hydrogenedentota bacterium]